MDFLKEVKLVKPIEGKFVEGISTTSCKLEEAKYIHENINTLRNVLKEAGGIGIAAPQLGVNKKFFLIKMNLEKNNEHFEQLYFNASYVGVGTNDWNLNEGCLSYPKEGGGTIRNDTYRFSEIEVDYEIYDPKKHELVKITKEKHKGTCHGVVIQHETDHLYGVTIFYPKKT